MRSSYLKQNFPNRKFLRNPLQGKESMTAAHDIGNTAGINTNEETSAHTQPWDNSFILIFIISLGLYSEK